MSKFKVGDMALYVEGHGRREPMEVPIVRVGRKWVYVTIYARERGSTLNVGFRRARSVDTPTASTRPTSGKTRSDAPKSMRRYACDTTSRLSDGQAALRRWGKRTAGRQLDGRTWDQYPVANGDPS